MRIPLVRPNMPKLEEIQQYYQLAEKHGQYSNFGLCYDIAVTKLQKVYPGSHPVLVNNGTTAIQVALQATLPRGSRVALPTFTFIATLNAVVAAGMVPVLFDVDPLTWQIDWDLLRSNLDKFDAVIVVSPFGYAVDIAMNDMNSSMLRKPVIYDFAPAWGHPIFKENPTTFSFHATKTLPTGEGGAVMLPDEIYALDGRRLINFDIHNGNIKTEYGMNGKMDELHAAVLCAQLDRNEEHLEGPKLSERLVKELVHYSDGYIKGPRVGESFLQLPVVKIQPTKLKQVMVELTRSGIACKEYYKPHLHEAFPDIPFIFGKEINTPLCTLGIARPCNGEEVDNIVQIVFNAVRK